MDFFFGHFLELAELTIEFYFISFFGNSELSLRLQRGAFSVSDPRSSHLSPLRPACSVAQRSMDLGFQPAFK